MISPIPVGIEDFRKLRELKLAYVDKSHLIREMLDATGVETVLLPRPRRFGKSLNLSMLRCFFEKREEDLSHLFSDLSIWQAGEAYRAHFQRYPVLHLNLKGTKLARFEDCWGTVKLKITRLFSEHRELLDGDLLRAEEAQDFRAILDGTAETSVFLRALLDLSTYLHRQHGEKVVLLIDEYDEPIHAGYVHGFAPQIIGMMRGLLTEALKGNPHLFRGVLTGILRIAKENIFSGLNNVSVYTLLAQRYRTCFGFTEPEVVTLLERVGRSDALDAVRAWYNGYLFGGEVIYNPWSVMSFLHQEDTKPRAYWVGTSSNDMVRNLLERHALEVVPVFEELLRGGSIERVLDDNVILSELDGIDKLWSLLVFTGYLKAQEVPNDPLERDLYRLSIPNREVRDVYSTTFQTWMARRMAQHGADLGKLTGALLAGDAETLEEQLQAFVTNLLSYHDTGSTDPERVYHGFVLGLLAVMEPDYLVRSNRESGTGRPDVTIRPRLPGKPAAVLELKVAKPGKKTPAAALREGLAQIQGRGYEAELTAAGASLVHAFVVAFDGKQVWVKAPGRGGKSAGRPKKRVAVKRAAPRKTPVRRKAH